MIKRKKYGNKVSKVVMSKVSKMETAPKNAPIPPKKLMEQKQEQKENHHHHKPKK